MRVWLANTLMNDPGLSPITGARVFPRESMDSGVVQYPYLVTGLGNSTDETMSEDPADFEHMPERQFFQVWIHDKLTERGGSYIQIDDIISLVKAALVGKGSPEDAIINIFFLETSGEFSNKALGTVFRYLRFQAVLGKVAQ